MSTRICCVRSCNKTRGDKCILHKFPDPNNDFERFKAWVNFIDGDLFSLGSDIMYENYRLCESHFEPKFKSTSGRVTRNAVPTLLLSGNVNNPVPQVDSAPAEKQTESIDVSENSPNESDILTWLVKSDTVPIPEAETENAEENTNIFSWEVGKEPELVCQDEPEYTDDVPDDLSMYCDDGAPSMTVTEVGRRCWHQGFHCDNCKGDIIGFRYTCVQCSNLDLCVTCESNSAHAHHYMLRIPEPRPYNEIQIVLARIRKLLMKEFDPISAADEDNEDAVSVKSEIKSEDEADAGETTESIDTLAEDIEKTENRISSSESQCSENADCELEKDSNIHIQKQVKISNQEKYQRIPVVLLDNIDSILTNSIDQKYIVKLSDSIEPKQYFQTESRVASTAIAKLTNSMSPKEFCQTESTVVLPSSTAKSKFILKPPESVEQKESNQPESIVTSIAKRKFILKLPDSVEPKESNQPQLTATSTAKRKYIVKLPNSIESKESNQAKSTPTSTAKRKFILELPDSVEPTEANRPQSTATSTAKRKYIVKLPDSIESKESNQAESTPTSTAKRKYIVKLLDSIEPKESTQPAKEIFIIPSTSRQEMKTVTTICNPASGPNQMKYKFVKLAPGALIKQGQTVRQVYAPKKPQTNIQDGKS